MRATVISNIFATDMVEQATVLYISVILLHVLLE